MTKREDILKALSIIIDPDLNKDIVSLGFIKELVIDGGTVSFSIELTTPACPVKNQFKAKAEELVSALPGIGKVNVTMTSRNNSRENKDNGLKQVKTIIAVASAKGGVGKSTVAASLASELNLQGHKVGLLDADLFGPSIPTLFNIRNPEVMQQGKMLLPINLNGMKLMSFGFLLGDAPAIMRGPMVSSYLQQILLQVDWGELDYLIIDMPPGTGDIQLTLSQTIQLDGALIVTTAAKLSLVDVARGILMFEKVGVPMLGIVENMSYYQCPDCNNKHKIFGNTYENLTERFGLEMLAEIPIEIHRGRSFEAYQSDEIILELINNMARALGKIAGEKVTPPELNQKGKEIFLRWNEEQEYKIDALELRNQCRCALCVDEYSGEKILQKEDIPENISVEKITALGNYALAIHWSDGHSSSIYPYKQLKEILKLTT